MHTRRKPLAKDISLEDLAQETDGLVGADLASICQKASLLAIREFLASQEEDLEKFTLEKRHFMEEMKDAIALINNRSST